MDKELAKINNVKNSYLGRLPTRALTIICGYIGLIHNKNKHNLCYSVHKSKYTDHFIPRICPKICHPDNIYIINSFFCEHHRKCIFRDISINVKRKDNMNSFIGELIILMNYLHLKINPSYAGYYYDHCRWIGGSTGVIKRNWYCNCVYCTSSILL